MDTSCFQLGRTQPFSPACLLIGSHVHLDRYMHGPGLQVRIKLKSAWKICLDRKINGRSGKARPISNYRLPDLGSEHTRLPPLKTAKAEICSVTSIVERNDNTDCVGNFFLCNDWENTPRQEQYSRFMPSLSSFSQSSSSFPFQLSCCSSSTVGSRGQTHSWGFYSQRLCPQSHRNAPTSLLLSLM